MSASLYGFASIPGSPDLSRPSSRGQSRTSSVRPSGSRPSQSHIELISHADAYNIPCAENMALTTSSPGSRPARPFTLSPGTNPCPIIPLHSAISDPYLSYPTDQHVLPGQNVLNYRPITHHPGLSPIPGHQVSSPIILESSELSSSSSRHAVINSHSTRPRTSNQVFNSISDLASHYGIPQFLPTAPRTTPRRTEIEAVSSPQPPEAFLSSPGLQSLCSNYLTMLSQEPGDGGANDVQTEGTVSAPPSIQVSDDTVQSIMNVLNATPELQMSNDLNEYLTSPLIDSPFDDDLLTTPAVGTDMYAEIMRSPIMDYVGDMSFDDFPPLFVGNDPMYEGSKSSQSDNVVGPQQSFPVLFTIESPSTPLVDCPSTPLPIPKIVPSKRKSTVTGTRKNLTPESLVPVDGPIQSRNYLTPSATSRKQFPATFRRKRLRAAGAGEEVDQLAEESLAPTVMEQEQIAAKRRQNTIAARRSRLRKLEHQRELEESLEQCKEERELWKQRALTCQALLRSHHVECPDFPDS